MPDIVSRLQGDIKTALKAADKQRAHVLRLLLAAVKQRQIDSREEVDDAALIAIVEKMIKQRRESIHHYQKAGRDDLRMQEEAEIALLQPFMPAMMSDAEIAAAIDQACSECAASAMKDMGKVMAALKPRLAGRADMAAVSQALKTRLSAPS